MREWLKNMTLFYVIILLMISIPIIVIFTVLSIKTIIALRYWIIGVTLALFLLFVFIVYRNRKRYKDNIRKNTHEVLKILEHAIRSGHDVDISVMGGLLKISYKSKNNDEHISVPYKETFSLPESIGSTQPED